MISRHDVERTIQKDMAELMDGLLPWQARVVRPRLKLLSYQVREDDFYATRQTFLKVSRDAVEAIKDRTLHMPSDFTFDETRLDEVDDEYAETILAEYHYLNSPRREGINLGLWLEKTKMPACLVTFNEFDLPHLRDKLNFDLDTKALLLSRQVTLTEKRNTWTFAFGRILRWLSEKFPEINYLVTYVDPNLDFNGASYKAANWQFEGEEPKGRYVFCDGLPITNRQLIEKFGTARFDELDRSSGLISKSQVELEPLKIFVYELGKGAKNGGCYE